MIEIIAAIITSFGVVFVAELGDKTQLLALGFGAQHSLRLVAVGLTLGYAVANLLAVVVGGILGAALPQRPIQIVSGLVFLFFAFLALRRDDVVDEADLESLEVPKASTRPKLVGSIALAIAIAEMGDKTQITTATLASQSPPVAIWIGATLGAASSGMVGAVAGRSIGHRISTRAVDVASAALFAAFGVAMLTGWF